MERNNNSGVLFRNNKREKDSQPMYTGDCMVNGVELRIAAWVKTSQSGNSYMSLSFSIPQPAPQPAQAQPAQPVTYAQPAPMAPDNDPLPF